MFNSILYIWSENAAVSLGIWLALMVVMMYLGREQAHQLFRSVGRSLYGSMRLFSRSLAALEINAIARNKEVLIAHGKEQIERSIEREFSRVKSHVERDLSAYPVIHRQIKDLIDNMEKDYQSSTDSPPLPPAWLDAVETISAIPRNGDPAVTAILDNILKTVESAHRDTRKAYQKASMERHKLLSSMQPEWRNLNESLGSVERKIDTLDDQSARIDEQMARYEAMCASDEKAVRVLSASSLTHFFSSALVLAVAILGGLINFQLIAMPMSEMVGGTSYIGSMQTSSIAALVIIMVEIAMGLFLMESLRVTRLFPVIGSMDDKLRRKMLIISFSILAILAGVEASLAYMRDLLALDREALAQSLSGVGAGVVEARFRWIPSIGQMILGFILPFALAFVAIPLESLIHASRTILGMLTVLALRGLRVMARISGGLALHGSRVLISLYDLSIMLPISCEKLIRAKRATALASQAGQADEKIETTKDVTVA